MNLKLKYKEWLKRILNKKYWNHKLINRISWLGPNF